ASSARDFTFCRGKFMERIVYCVYATFGDEKVANQWLAWLRDGHLSQVLAGGATDAEVTRLDGPEHILEVRYHFASRDAFEKYERDLAPRLRAEGLRLFPTERGTSYRRSVGVVL
ncbi:MAG: DUF4286 family protein, partial [Tepidisphaeraceae bacterium]